MRAFVILRHATAWLAAAAVGAGLAVAVHDSLPAAALTTAPGFADRAVISGLNSPSAVAFAPDGRVFVAERAGIIKVFDNLADSSPGVLADLRRAVYNFWDRGLLGLAVDPAFPTRPYLYALYTYDALPGGAAPHWNDACPSPPGPNTDGCLAQARLSRLTVTGDTMSAEKVLIEGWCQQYPSHSIGTVAFGPDGALYAGAGEGASFGFADYGQVKNPCGDPPGAAGTNLTPPAAEGGALRAQSVRRPAGQPVVLGGSIVRVDPDTGAALPGGPFASHPSPDARRIIAYGMRNPFRFTIRPGTDEMWVGDVGWTTWEEINRISGVGDAVAENFGWPCFEGAARHSGYDGANLNRCESLYTAGTATPPYFAYQHSAHVVAGDPCPTGSSAVGGLAFEDDSDYPAQYTGALFFADATRGCIWTMPRGADGQPDRSDITPFVTGAGTIVQLLTGPGGDLFYVDLKGSVHQISYLAGNSAPTARITASATSGQAPLEVRLDATTSTDPESDPLTYQWDLDGDGTFDDSTEPRPVVTYQTEGERTVRLRVTDAHQATATDALTVTVGASPTSPVPVIDAPGSDLRWTVGETVAFRGHATDPQDGTLPPSRLSWSLVMQHCPSNCHTHVIEDLDGVASGSFAAPDHEYPSHLELRLTATDSSGRSATTSVRLDPRTVELTFVTDPGGIPVQVSDRTVATPARQTFIVGSQISVSAPRLERPATELQEFASWSDGGAATHNLTVPPTPTTYTARYRPAPPAVLVAAYSFDEGSGTTAADASGNHHTATLSGARWSSAGRARGALFFDGRASALTVPDAAGVRLSRGMTVEAWVRPSGLRAMPRPPAQATPAGPGPVVVKEAPGGVSYGLYSRTDDPRPAGYVLLGGSRVATQGSDTLQRLPADRWSHLAVTYDGLSLSLWVDGVLRGSVPASGPIVDAGGALRVGANQASGEYFGGLVDEVRIWDRDRSADQIARDMATPVGTAPRP